MADPELIAKVVNQLLGTANSPSTDTDGDDEEPYGLCEDCRMERIGAE